MLQDQRSFEFIDDEVFNKLDRLLDIADSVSLMIDGFDEGKSFGIECPIGKGLALCLQ